MLAGFSFLSRISKYFCERCGIFDFSSENWVELEEEKEKKNEKLEKLENSEKNTTNIELRVSDTKPHIENNSSNPLKE